MSIFYRTQGACVASVKPEYLMEPRDYKCWVQLQREVEMKKNKSGHWETKPKTEEDEAIEDQLFEAVSKRAWTDILMQILKVGLLVFLKDAAMGTRNYFHCRVNTTLLTQYPIVAS